MSTNITVNAVGTGLEFHCSNSDALDWEIWVSNSEIQPSPQPHFFPIARKQHSSTNGVAQKTFAPAFYELGVNTLFNYIVRCGGSYATGQIKTLHSSVSVKFIQIDVIDDSDALSEGDLTFFFNLNGQWHGELTYSAGVSSGDSSIPLNPGPILVDMSTRYLTIAVNGQDDDTGFGQLNTTGLGPRTGGGSDSQMDWATAESGKIDVLRSGTPNLNSVSKDVTFETTNQNKLKFKVHARVDADYFP